MVACRSAFDRFTRTLAVAPGRSSPRRCVARETTQTAMAHGVADNATLDLRRHPRWTLVLSLKANNWFGAQPGAAEQRRQSCADGGGQPEADFTGGPAFVGVPQSPERSEYGGRNDGAGLRRAFDQPPPPILKPAQEVVSGIPYSTPKSQADTPPPTGPDVQLWDGDGGDGDAGAQPALMFNSGTGTRTTTPQRSSERLSAPQPTRPRTQRRWSGRRRWRGGRADRRTRGLWRRRAGLRRARSDRRA